MVILLWALCFTDQNRLSREINTIMQMPVRSFLRKAIQKAYRCDEDQVVVSLLSQLEDMEGLQAKIDCRAERLVKGIHQHQVDRNGIESFMAQYDLSSEEGIAIMCLAEALTRIPDKKTANVLIADKIARADWEKHIGESDSLFVNASTWGLLLTGKFLKPAQDNQGSLKRVLKKFVLGSSEPIVRATVLQAMKIMGEQFVMGQTIEAAIKRAKRLEKKGYCYSYDMLGEAAHTATDADRYFQEYQLAIKAISQVAISTDSVKNPSVSVKLSALHPCYRFAQRDRLIKELTPRLLNLAQQAKAANIDLTVDAEEAEMLEVSLDIIEKVFMDSSLVGWEGLGLAVQAYQKRATFVLDYLIGLARQCKKRLMVRLVKGAYWDSEIKAAQVLGLNDYPVFTRKYSTDISFLVCVKKMLAARDVLYCQFASHNAYSVATILEMAGDHHDYEFQCLHGIGEALYDQLVTNKQQAQRCRIYAPVGNHRDLLPYLVRRLLENGANTSFINRMRDLTLPPSELIKSPVEQVKPLQQKRHPCIPFPRDIYQLWQNSTGIDLSSEEQVAHLQSEMAVAFKKNWFAAPIINGRLLKRQAKKTFSPIDGAVIGQVAEADMADVEQALSSASAVQWDWNATAIEYRASCLEKAANLLQDEMSSLIAYAVREAGKTIADAVAEVREAIDFCRYYAYRARIDFQPREMPGPTGEFNLLSLHGRGVAVCISPWNFPLAIFMGQIVASLVAGNTVIAKPAEQTAIIATRAVQLLHQAGIPKKVLQLLPGKGETIGAKLVADQRVKVVIFTGSTTTARAINQLLANRLGAIIPLIAETGGQNTMIVDSSALLEQVLVDVMISAFGSAGQRCSALRVLFVQQDIAPRFIEMLTGAMAELRVGNPMLLATDVGPVIDQAARSILKGHHDDMLTSKHAKLLCRATLTDEAKEGVYFAPCAWEIEQLSQLKQEVFGPCLHIIRYRSSQLDQVLAQIRASGYGLTQGIHSRVNYSVEKMQNGLAVGNLYINRNMTGAVVGVQPFGGEGLSGTGPKAGGPHYLLRLATERTISIDTTAVGGNASLLTLDDN